jgi:hypothetical protein
MQDIIFIRYSVPSLNEKGTSYQGEYGFTDDLSLAQRGLRLLVSMTIKWLMQSPGSDAVSPGLGGGLMELTALGPIDEEVSAIAMNVVLAIKATKDQIIKYQWGKSYPADETLENLELERTGGIVFDKDNKRWQITLVLRSAAGESARFGLGVPGLGNTDVARVVVS